MKSHKFCHWPFISGICSFYTTAFCFVLFYLYKSFGLVSERYGKILCQGEYKSLEKDFKFN